MTPTTWEVDSEKVDAARRLDDLRRVALKQIGGMVEKLSHFGEAPGSVVWRGPCKSQMHNTILSRASADCDAGNAVEDDFA